MDQPTISPDLDSKPAKHSNMLLIIIFFLFLLATLAAVFFYLQTQTSQQKLEDAAKYIPIGETANAPSPSPDPTVDWKTYTSDGYTFKYPQSWDNQCQIDSVCVQSPDIEIASETDYEAGLNYVKGGGVFGLNVMTDPIFPQSDLNTFCSTGGPLILESCEPAIFQNIQAIRRVTSKPGTTDNYILIKDGLIYSIGLAYDLKNIDVKKTLNQILSTFKFTDSVSPTSTSTKLSTNIYTNTTFQYQLTLPPGWSYIDTKDAQNMPTVHFKKNISKKATYSSRSLPEIYIGGGSVYSTSWGVCFTQSCTDVEPLDLLVNLKPYRPTIIKGEVNNNFDFYSLQFTLTEGGTKISGFTDLSYPTITASYANEAEKTEILQLLSSLKFNK